MGIGEKFLDSPIPSFDLIDDGIDFDTIARRQQYSFPHSLVRTETGQGFAYPALRNREFLADLHRGGLMAQADDNNMHLKTPVRDS